jgi:hypothetical protein
MMLRILEFYGVVITGKYDQLYIWEILDVYLLIKHIHK